MKKQTTRNTNRNTKKKKNNEKDFDLISFSIFMMFVSVVIMISVISNNTGLLGEYIGKFFIANFGIISYLLPIIIFITFLNIVRKKTNKRKLIFVYILMLMTMVLLSSRYLASNLKDSMNLSEYELVRSGGKIGSFLAFYLEALIGIVGIILTYIFLFVVTLVELTGGNYEKFFLNIKNSLIRFFNFIQKSFYKLKRKYELRKTKREIKENKSNKEKDNKKDLDIKENFKEEIEEKKSEPTIVRYEMDQINFSDINKNLKRNFNNYNYPSINLFDDRSHSEVKNKKEFSENSRKIEETLQSFGIESEVVTIDVGPTVTCYELKPARGIKVSRIVNLADDLSLALASSDIRIEAPIPGKPYVGIEVPNRNMEIVGLKELLSSDAFISSKAKLPFILGKSTSGKPMVSDISKMPHLLIAGATGSGKSVCINTIIMSLIYKFSPEEVKLLMIDPKMVELSVYNGIPHLIMPVISNPKKASSALYWAVSEMERRYKLFGKYSVRDITSYKKRQEDDDSMENLPYEVVIIDELSDLMMVSANEVEDYIIRLAQMSRACGIHLIIATQRPTVDVITGTIKANIPSRISFAVSSQIDSRTILDMSGAEKLLGKGDMLFYASDFMKPVRIQGAFVSDSEVSRVVNSIKEENKSEYDEEAIEKIEENVKVESEDLEEDELIDEAIDIILNENTASVSLLQRKLRIGYARAGRIIDQLEKKGIVGGYEGSKPRKVLVDKSYLEDNN
ncbi:MAG: DNA translocase FtsK 4TM domain-containing protein [Tissierellia bacterium]|nr:DNA translocase FtsK 4TM domain-containing protein [Tissierellia bacterium]